MSRIRTWWIGGITMLLAVVAAAPVFAQEIYPRHNLEIVTATGVTAKTIEGTVFSLALQADHYLAPNVSIGPMAVLNSGNALMQGGVAAVARYYFRTPALNVVPFVGGGAMHADIRSITTWGWWVPAGLSLELPVRDTILTATGMVSLHDFNFKQGLGEDPKSFTLMLGVRFQP